MILYMYITLRARADNLELEAKNHFSVHLGQGQITPNGVNLLASQEDIITLNICCKFQRDCFEL